MGTICSQTNFVFRKFSVTNYEIITLNVTPIQLHRFFKFESNKAVGTTIFKFYGFNFYF
ncbi:hypothetical protein LEP1GSC018_1050 [Leptospira kirschneri str. 2008720114]|nr:hypothetical protein LEP1GSC018_1050 [Leptospira kirschneri str. 2008720114]